jgi:hypothetical protein
VFLPELLNGIEGAPLQAELSRVRLLLELLGFLLSGARNYLRP